MTADIVNLRRQRKTKLRAEKTAAAVTNRALFGRTRAERERQALETTRATSHFEGHKLAVAVDKGDGETS